MKQNQAEEMIRKMYPEDPWEKKMEKVRTKVKSALRATYEEAATDSEKMRIFNQLVDMFVEDAGTMSMALILANTK